MNASKKICYFRVGLLVAVSLLLGTLFQGSALAAQKGGGLPSGITIKAVSGKVVQFVNSGGYTYALVEKDGLQSWVAMPVSQIAVGDEISCRPGGEMNNFTSKSLRHTFRRIVFSSGLLSRKTATPQTAKAQATPATKAAGAKLYTIAEVFGRRAELANKPVAVKGKVVKVNSGIMGRNWVHLQDGTGDKAAGTNELVVTTNSDAPKVGDMVTISGNLSVDRDFGSNYKYKVIVEGAQVNVNK